MNPPPTCPECGVRLLAEEGEGLCPRCLMQLALQPLQMSDEELGRCPTDDQLRQFAEGVLPDPEARSVSEHVEVCPACRISSDGLGTSVRPKSNGTKPEATVLEFLEPSGPSSSHFPGDSIPGYQILREIHRGGQGVVYQAVQKSTKRRVAIKVMREGPFAGPHERSRFEREVQILAALQHPHIVSVLDSGEASGNFYFTMDYISGDALDQYVKQRNLPVDDILRLFVNVCEAVNAAHLRGIIHRDLKPANIRVDTEGEPHILDFGLARVALGALTDASRPQMMTVTGDFVGSPPWAAPEQAEGLPHLIDVRTDVYALGVILFQMLTGRFPYDVTGNVLEVLERIRIAEPVKPSTLRRGIRDEVETIVLKCLAKERDRRYQSAGELARDIRHYLDGEPIEAKRDSTLYVLRKTLRRYRVPVAVTLAFMMLLSVSLVVSVSLWFQAEENFRAAEEGRQAAIEARQFADTKTREAEASAQAAEASAREARRRLYSRQMALAQQALETGSGSLKDLLLECPAEFRGWEWYRLAALADRSRITVKQAGEAPSAIFSPDGNWVASVGANPILKLWDARTGQIAHAVDNPGYNAQWVSFSSAGDRIALCGHQQDFLEVWDLSAWRQLWALALRARCAVFEPTGKRIAVGMFSGEILILESNTGEEYQVLNGHDQFVDSLAYSADGRWLASASYDGTARIWDTESGESLHTLRGHGSRVFTVAFSPDNRYLASSGEDQTVRIWDPGTGREQAVLRGHTLAVNTVAFSPDGSRLCSGGRDGTVRLWNPNTGEALSILRGHSRSIRRVAFNPDGQSILSAARDGTIKIWETVPTPDERVFYASEQGISSLAFSANGEQLLATGKGAILVWDVATGRRLESVDTGADPDMTASDRLHRLRFDSEGLLYVEDVATGHARKVQHEDHKIRVAHFRPDGGRFATCCACGMLQTWDAPTGKLLVNLQSESSDFDDFAYSPDGKRIATCSQSVMRLWDAETLETLGPEVEHPNIIQDIAFTPDGSRIVTAGWTDIRVLDAETGDLLLVFGAAKSYLYHRLAISPDGRTIAASTGRIDLGPRTIKIWEAADPREFEGHSPWGDTPQEQSVSPETP